MNEREAYGGSTLPLYQSTKRVRAVQILVLEHRADGWVARPIDQPETWIDLPPGYVQRFQPVPNGYFLLHADGHASYMTRLEFEATYATAADLVDRRAHLEQQLAHVNAAIAASEKA